ncbi:hypothetical protein ACH4SK_17565 [Streptomyces inhibens]|uniref:hypothetical protein n=1 Tax=Streptomyces inhibens TaxID=2293571 RepID=UPI0037957731
MTDLSLDPSPASLHDPADFALRMAAAWDWFGFAIDAQQEGDWVLDDVERHVLADLVVAANPLHGGRLPPHTQDSLYVRVGRISKWAGVLRLAARAGGWELFPVAGEDPSVLTRPVGMADMLSGFYALAEQGERWQKLILATAEMLNADTDGSLRQGRTLEQVIRDRNPRFENDLAAAEAFFTGPGSLDDLPQFFC